MSKVSKFDELLTKVQGVLESRWPYVTLVAPRGWGKSLVSDLVLKRLNPPPRVIPIPLYTVRYKNNHLPPAPATGSSPPAAGSAHGSRDPDAEGHDFPAFLHELDQRVQRGELQSLALVIDGVGPLAQYDQPAFDYLADLMDSWRKLSSPPPRIVINALPEARESMRATLSRTRVFDLEEFFREDPSLIAEAALTDYLRAREESLADYKISPELPPSFGRLLLLNAQNFGPVRQGRRLLEYLATKRASTNLNNLQVALKNLDGAFAGLFWRDGWTEGDLLGELQSAVKGQDTALEEIAKAIRAGYAPFHNPERPRAAVLLSGPTGVGKTETARTIAKAGFGSERFLTRFDMGEFQEAHTVSRLVGAPAGYVGYEEGGQLTQVLRESPRRVLLFDEVEKAHENIQRFLLALLDTGRMTDARGQKIDAREAIILMTTNAPREQFAEYFLPEFLGRVKEVEFAPLKQKALGEIADQRASEIASRLAGKLTITLDAAARAELANRALSSGKGARGVEQILSGLLAEVAEDVEKKLKRHGRADVQIILDSSGKLQAIV